MLHILSNMFQIFVWYYLDSKGSISLTLILQYNIKKKYHLNLEFFKNCNV